MAWGNWMWINLSKMWSMTEAEHPPRYMYTLSLPALTCNSSYSLEGRGVLSQKIGVPFCLYKVYISERCRPCKPIASVRSMYRGR